MLLASQNIIPQSIIDQANQHFNPQIIIKGRELLDKARINVSFQKGRPQKFFIISGIINDGNTTMTQISFKPKTGELTTTCDCPQSQSEGTCPHAAALFIRFHLNHLEQNEQNPDRPGAVSVSVHGQGVHPEIYGELIKNPQYLAKNFNNATFSSLQYMLRNRKVTYLPLPQKFNGKIHINLMWADQYDKYATYPMAEKLLLPLFSIETEQGESKTISLFDTLYIFDWESGDAYEIPNDFKGLLERLKNDGPLIAPGDAFILLAPWINRDDFNLHFDSQSLADLPHELSQLSFEITKSKRNNYLSLSLSLLGNDDQLIPLPVIFKLLSHEAGILSTFKSKADAHNFLLILSDSLIHDNNEYRKKCHLSSKRTDIIDWANHLQTQWETIQLDDSQKHLYSFENQKFKIILVTLLECFGANFCRFSEFRSHYVQFDIPKNTLFQGIASFYKKLHPLGINILYNKKEIKNWTAGIRFERERSQTNWFELKMIVSDQDYKIIKNASFGENYLVQDDELVILSDQENELLKFMKKYTAFESEEDKTLADDSLRRFSLNFKRARIFELFELKKHGIDGALTTEEEKLCENLLNLKSMPHYELPVKFQEIARTYQVEGYNWLRFLYENKFGACLADDMGLGKTLQTIMLIESVYSEVNRVLIVCPVSLLINWEKEIERFSTFKTHVYYGGERSLPKDCKVLLTSYGVMKKEAETTFKDLELDILIMDEVQHLKNIRSLGANAARALQANFRICLTGTPVENDLSEFYNIMDLSIPGIWGETSFFKSTSNKKSRLLARKTVRPFILRRTKDQVLKELPPKEEHHIFLSFDEKQKENYLTKLTQIRHRLDNLPPGRKYGEVLKGLLELRQLCLWQGDQGPDSTKIDFLCDQLEQILEENHKAIVFSQFTTYLNIIQNRIMERGWKYTRIDGSLSLKKRGQAVDAFQNGDAQIFLISLKAGGVGLNLTAASYIFLMDPWWNPAVENQAIDRAHRIGQENKVVVYRPIVKDSVEEKVLILQNHKKELFADLMGDKDDQYFTGKLTMDDFQSLLSN